MDHCPYCNAEIEPNATVCDSCGRYLAVEVTPLDKLGPAGESFRERWGSRRIVFHSYGCGSCTVRFLLLVCLVLGIWWKTFWIMALFLLAIELSVLFNRK